MNSREEYVSERKRALGYGMFKTDKRAIRCGRARMGEFKKYLDSYNIPYHTSYCTFTFLSTNMEYEAFRIFVHPNNFDELTSIEKEDPILYLYNKYIDKLHENKKEETEEIKMDCNIITLNNARLKSVQSYLTTEGVLADLVYEYTDSKGNIFETKLNKVRLNIPINHVKIVQDFYYTNNGASMNEGLFVSMGYGCDAMITGGVETKCIYHRPPVKMTVKEIEEKLGYTVEIISEEEDKC